MTQKLGKSDPSPYLLRPEELKKAQDEIPTPTGD